MDSNHRFLVGRSNRDGRPAWLSRKGSGSVGEPKVRIHLPPAVSPQTFGPSRVAANTRSLVPAAHSRVPAADQPDLAGYDIHIDRHGRKALKECLPAPSWSRFEAASGHAGSELFFRDKKLQLLARR